MFSLVNLPPDWKTCKLWGTDNSKQKTSTHSQAHQEANQKLKELNNFFYVNFQFLKKNCDDRANMEQAEWLKCWFWLLRVASVYLLTQQKQKTNFGDNERTFKVFQTKQNIHCVRRTNFPIWLNNKRQVQHQIYHSASSIWIKLICPLTNVFQFWIFELLYQIGWLLGDDHFDTLWSHCRPKH